MKKRVFSLLFGLAILCSSTVVSLGQCTDGGPGATSCSVQGAVQITPNWTVLGTKSVTCGAGYYACCSTSPLSAYCVLNSTGGQGNQ